ncbi:MAG: peptidylprolyl isomerase [Candidatus Thiodiazotropha sp. (ex Ustalcina ferruginea)]|nr:peptidylprolyl isomerase [Candidatus Thiodiazotropha sp. (ex Ustalcina ferruginea)]
MMRITLFLYLYLVALVLFAGESNSRDEAIVMTHKSGIEISKQELVDEIEFIRASKQLDKLPNKEVLEKLSLQLLITKMLSAEALASNLDEDPLTAYELMRSRVMVLAQSRMRQLESVTIDEAVKKQLGKEYYFNHEDEFTEPEQRQISHILVKTHEGDAAEKLEQAEQLLKTLQASPEQFTKLAKEHSDDKGSGMKGGALGWATRDRFVKPFADAAFSIAKTGEIVGPTKTQFGYHIIKLDDMKASRLTPYSEVEETAITKAVESFREERKSSYLNNLRASGDRKLNDAVINDYLKELIEKAEEKEKTD